MAFKGAAAVVVAYAFQLIDPFGAIVASLSTGSGGGFVPNGAFSQLDMRHNDPITTDSSLGWTQNGATGTEYTRLEGPVDAGGGLSFRPQIQLYRNAMGPNPLTGVAFTAGRSTGNPAAAGSPTLIMENTVATGVQRFDIQSDTSRIQTGGGSDRGALLGITFDHGAGAGANTTVNPVAQVTLNMPAGAAGSRIDVTCSAYCTSLIVANIAFLEIYLDGVASGALRGIASNWPVGQAATIHSFYNGPPPSTNAFTIQGVIYGTVANNTYNMAAVTLEVVYYR